MTESDHAQRPDQRPLATAYRIAVTEHIQKAEKHKKNAVDYAHKGQQFRRWKEGLKASRQLRNADADRDRARSSSESDTPNGEEPKGVDLAALLGATIAAALTLTFSPGAWGPFSTIIGSLLLVALLTFFWRRRISPIQRRISPEKVGIWESFLVGLALSAVVGLVGAIASAEAVQNLVFGDHANRFECRSVAVAQATMAVNNLDRSSARNGLLQNLIDETLNPGGKQSVAAKQPISASTLTADAAVRFAFYDQYESAISDCLANETTSSLWPIGLSCAALTLVWWNWNLIPLFRKRLPTDLKKLSHRNCCPLVRDHLTVKR